MRGYPKSSCRQSPNQAQPLTGLTFQLPLFQANYRFMDASFSSPQNLTVQAAQDRIAHLQTQLLTQGIATHLRPPPLQHPAALFEHLVDALVEPAHGSVDGDALKGGARGE